MISASLPSWLRFELNVLFYDESKLLCSALYYQGKLLGAIEITRQLAYHIIFNPVAPVELKLAALGATWLMFEGQREKLAINAGAFWQLPLEWQVSFIVQVIFMVVLFSIGGLIPLGLNTPFFIAAISLISLPHTNYYYQLFLCLYQSMVQRAQDLSQPWSQPISTTRSITAQEATFGARP